MRHLETSKDTIWKLMCNTCKLLSICLNLFTHTVKMLLHQENVSFLGHSKPSSTLKHKKNTRRFMCVMSDKCFSFAALKCKLK